MQNLFKKKFKSLVSRKMFPLRRKLEHLAVSQWNDWPFGREPLSTKDEYIRLSKEVRKKTYPEIESYEKKMGFFIDEEWLHELALHTQVVIKESPLCYAHGRVLYTALSKYLAERQATTSTDRLTIWETGTARGFSALCMAKALYDQQCAGTIVTFDVLPHNTIMYWNCIDDLEKPKTRSELLNPWRSLVQDFIIFNQGDTRMELSKVKAERINFAFLDGGHTYEDVMFEFKQIQNHQLPGDVIVYDDYTPDQFPGIVRAVDKICSTYNHHCEVLKANSGRGYVVAVKL